MSQFLKTCLYAITMYRNELIRSNNHEIAEAISKETDRLSSSLKRSNSLTFSKNDENILRGFFADFEKGKKISNHQLVIGAVRELADFYEKKVNGNI